MTSNGRQPKNIKSRINQQLLIGSYSNDLKIFKVKYLSNQLLEHTQIFNLSLDDQTYYTNPINEDDLKIYIVE